MSRLAALGVASAGSLLGAAALAACGLSVSGLATSSADASPPSPPAPLDGSIPGPEDASGAHDAGTPADAASGLDASGDASVGPALDAAAACAPFDAGIGGALALSAFVVKGSAVYNENSDGRLTLTNSQNSQSGAGWYPTPMSGVAGYDLTWSLRVGPGDTAGDGVVFAVLQSNAAPGVGDDADGLGLRNIAAPDGGTLSGYAVDVDMYKAGGDPTDLATTTLKLVTMPAFKVVAAVPVPVALNDGNTYLVDVSWRAPSTLAATLHGPGGIAYPISSSDPGLTATSPAYFGFTSSTGPAADSHNEAAGLTITMTCE